MASEIGKLKTLYIELDRLQSAGEDVVAELKKEINNLELSYLKENVFPQVAKYLASKVRDLRCGIDSSFQFDAEGKISFSFCTSESMLLVKDTLDIDSIPYSSQTTFSSQVASSIANETKVSSASTRLSTGLLYTSEREDNKNRLSEEQWITMLLSMKGTIVKGFTSPHKAIFILTIIELIQQGYIKGKRIFATKALSDTFIRIWNKYVPSNWPFRENVFQPFIHLSSEPFYYLSKAEGVNGFDINQGWTRNLVVKYVDHAYFDPQLFELFHNRAFTEILSKELLDKFIFNQIPNRSNHEVKESITPDAFMLEGYKHYLSTLTSHLGRPYTPSSINIYATALRSKYMQTKVSKFAGTTNLNKVSDISVIDKIIQEVKYEAEHGIVNKTAYLALKMYSDYRKHNSLSPLSLTSEQTVVDKSDKEYASNGKPVGIQSIDVEHIHIHKGDLNDMFATFLNEIGPDLVHDMKINYLDTNLIDTKENPFFVDSCIKLDGDYWVNVSPRPQTIVNQIKKICEILDMDVVITMEHEDITDGYKVTSKPRAKFSLNGGRPLNKRQTVLETIRLYLKTYPNATFEQIKDAFPKELQGGYGVVVPLSSIQRRIQNGYDDGRRFYLDRDKILCSSDGIQFAVCHQWGHQFSNFQSYIQTAFNWSIEEV